MGGVIKYLEDRPTCVNIGCDRVCHISNKSATGKHIYRPYCARCHNAIGGRDTFKEGVIPIKKDYCENIDGRLGFTCTATIMSGCQLDLDHIDGEHFHNTADNIQTLCKNCHSYKTKINGDSKTPTKRVA